MSADFAPMKTHWMLVDDDADILRVLAAVVVTITDAEIETFCSASEAFAAFAAEPEKYQLVITDYEMPEMDGVELCRRMRVLVLNQNIFLASGGGFFTDAVAGRTGFGALLNKPFPISALREDWAKTFLKNESACAA